jgi:hypothetical protein
MNMYLLGFGLFLSLYYGPVVLQCLIHDATPSEVTKIGAALGVAILVGRFLL